MRVRFDLKFEINLVLQLILIYVKISTPLKIITPLISKIFWKLSIILTSTTYRSSTTASTLQNATPPLSSGCKECRKSVSHDTHSTSSRSIACSATSPASLSFRFRLAGAIWCEGCCLLPVDSGTETFSRSEMWPLSLYPPIACLLCICCELAAVSLTTSLYQEKKTIWSVFSSTQKFALGTAPS